MTGEGQTEAVLTGEVTGQVKDMLCQPASANGSYHLMGTTHHVIYLMLTSSRCDRSGAFRNPISQMRKLSFGEFVPHQAGGNGATGLGRPGS